MRWLCLVLCLVVFGCVWLKFRCVRGEPDEAKIHFTGFLVRCPNSLALAAIWARSRKRFLLSCGTALGLSFILQAIPGTIGVASAQTTSAGAFAFPTFCYSECWSTHWRRRIVCHGHEFDRLWDWSLRDQYQFQCIWKWGRCLRSELKCLWKRGYCLGQ